MTAEDDTPADAAGPEAEVENAWEAALEPLDRDDEAASEEEPALTPDEALASASAGPVVVAGPDATHPAQSTSQTIAAVGSTARTERVNR